MFNDIAKPASAAHTNANESYIHNIENFGQAKNPWLGVGQYLNAERKQANKH